MSMKIDQEKIKLCIELFDSEEAARRISDYIEGLLQIERVNIKIENIRQDINLK